METALCAYYGDGWPWAVTVDPDGPGASLVARNLQAQQGWRKQAGPVLPPTPLERGPKSPEQSVLGLATPRIGRGNWSN